MYNVCNINIKGQPLPMNLLFSPDQTVLSGSKHYYHNIMNIIHNIMNTIFSRVTFTILLR